MQCRNLSFPDKRLFGTRCAEDRRETGLWRHAATLRRFKPVDKRLCRLGEAVAALPAVSEASARQCACGGQLGRCDMQGEGEELGSGVSSSRHASCQVNILALETEMRRKISWSRAEVFRRACAVPLIATTILLWCPSVIVLRDSIHVLGSTANAQPMGQIRQALTFLERLAEGTTSGKVLDKVMTVISGQTVVSPETIEELKGIIEGKDVDDWKTEITNNIGSLWSTTIDAVLNFNPLSVTESAGASIQGLFEAGAERFAAYELSTLLALGERWLLWAPVIVLPMYWQMSRSKNSEEDESRKQRQDDQELTKEAIAKAERVKRELERVELKAGLLDAVYSLGETALQSSKREELKRRQIENFVERLQQLNHMSAITDVDGEWSLIYVSQEDPQSKPQQFSGFPILDLPGVELKNICQNVWHEKPSGLSTSSMEDGFDQMLTKNTAEVRLWLLGLMEVSVQGTWGYLTDEQSALISLSTFSVRPMELLGSHIREDLPSFSIPLPRTLQTIGKWKMVYLDESIRINQGTKGKIFIFKKI